jgi:hypothetical protein
MGAQGSKERIGGDGGGVATPTKTRFASLKRGEYMSAAVDTRRTRDPVHTFVKLVASFVGVS